MDNWEEKKPGFLARSAPGLNAYVMAREVIQNAWDAAHELRAPPPPPPEKSSDFHISFNFRHLNGADKTRLTDALDLGAHAERLSHLDRGQLRLADDLCLDRLGSADSLPVLLIEESATTGMYGPWNDPECKLYQALCTLGIGKDPKKGTGGSFGYGKAALIRGSAPRVVIAYTCFNDPAEPEVTRRLLGATYWGTHTYEGKKFLGIARWGSGDRPLENEHADRAAERLGIPIRDPRNISALGSTFLLLEPTVQPKDLEEAINRSWWPALEDRTLGFHVSISRSDGTNITPRPSRHPDLAPFVRAYRHASPPFSKVGRSQTLRRYEIGSRDRLWGHLALAVDLDDWSFPKDEGSDPDGQRDESLVAIMRKPRMVVEYLRKRSQHHQAPIIRGVFVAHERANEKLAATEPFGHDSWDHQGDPADPARKVARTVKDQINRHILDLQRSLRPNPPKPETGPLPDFDRIMRQILRGPGRPTPAPHPPRTVHIEAIKTRLESVDGGAIYTAGSARFGLTEHFLRRTDRGLVRVEVQFLLTEDERTTGEEIGVTVTPPPGFVLDGRDKQCFSGVLDGENLHGFTFETVPYNAEWSGRVVIAAGVVSEEE